MRPSRRRPARQSTGGAGVGPLRAAWDNGWGTPQEPGDTFESHPYAFCYFKPSRHLSMFSKLNPRDNQDQ